jgi:hypothetical protein
MLSDGTDCTTCQLQAYLLIVICIAAGASTSTREERSIYCRVCNFTRLQLMV